MRVKRGGWWSGVLVVGWGERAGQEPPTCRSGRVSLDNLVRFPNTGGPVVCAVSKVLRRYCRSTVLLHIITVRMIPFFVNRNGLPTEKEKKEGQNKVLPTGKAAQLQRGEWDHCTASMGGGTFSHYVFLNKKENRQSSKGNQRPRMQKYSLV